jgi:hypothetical protein
MARYTPSFVDVSGLTAGISRGLEMAAQQKKQDDQIAEARVDDFLKTYQPGKLYQMDIPKFTEAYNKYKQSALTFSKINRGGGKAEDLATSKAMMDNSLAELNKVYSNSSNRANLAAEYADVAKYAMQKGYSLPSEVSQYATALTSADLDQLDLPKIPSAYTFKIEPDDLDMADLNKTFELMKIKPSKREVVQPVDQGTYMGKPLVGRKVYTFQSLPMGQVVTALDVYSSTGKTGNALTRDMKAIKGQFDQMKQSDKDQLVADISTRMPSVQSEADITPSVLYAYNMSKESLVDDQLDDAFTKRSMQEIDNTISNSYKERQLQIAATNAATSRERANQKKGSSSYILEPDREITPWIKKNMGGSGTIDIPKNLVEGYYGASRTTFNKGKIVKATLNKATGEVTVTTNDGQTGGNYVNTYTPQGFIKVITSETPGTAKKSASDDDEDINTIEVPSIF